MALYRINSIVTVQKEIRLVVEADSREQAILRAGMLKVISRESTVSSKEISSNPVIESLEEVVNE